MVDDQPQFNLWQQAEVAIIGVAVTGDEYRLAVAFARSDQLTHERGFAFAVGNRVVLFALRQVLTLVIGLQAQAEHMVGRELVTKFGASRDGSHQGLETGGHHEYVNAVALQHVHQIGNLRYNTHAVIERDFYLP
ncbi:hypothetical protein D3C84_974020 [compost metagenome]